MRSILVNFLIAQFLFLLNCTNDKTTPSVKVHWEHITNFTDKPDIFESKFTLSHMGGYELTDSNWALFFNIAPRSMRPTPEPQPAKIEHLNGDWYRMVPNSGFRLGKSDSIEIHYRGIEAVIKESDRPLGLYFVFYDDVGEEKEIVEVENYTFAPFTSPNQINRSKDDYDPIPTPEFLYRSNQKLSQLPAKALGKIIPSPVIIKPLNGALELDESFTIVYDNKTESEARFLKDKLQLDAGLTLSMLKTNTGSKTIQLNIGEIAVNGNEPESYLLRISKDQLSITGSDEAGVFYGIQSLRSLIPISSLKDKGKTIRLKCQEIADTPRFGFRSLQLDVGRNFQSKKTVLRLLDVMAFYKLNHFLIYITEDEGWRLEIEGLPELTDIGAQRKHTKSYKNSVMHPAYGSGPFADSPNNHGTGYYSREDFIEILQYAKERHITVIPEVNFPGHSRAAIKAMEYRYERLMAEGNPKAADEFRLIDPDDESRYLSAQSYKDNVVCVVKEEVYSFYEKVLEDILLMYQEAGVSISKFHIGGDEVPQGAWTSSPLVTAFMKDHPEIKSHHELHAYFVKTMTERLEHKGLEWHGWEEVALKKIDDGSYQSNPEFIGKKIVPYIWNNIFDYPDIGYRLANAGYPVVLCNVSNFYFDLAYNKDPEEPGLYWGGFINERDNWTFAPFNMFRTTLNTSMGHDIHILRTEKRGSKQVDIAQIQPGNQPTFELERLNPGAKKNIIGLEAQIWSETIKGRDMLEYYYMPKIVSFAESAWAKERPWEDIDEESQRIPVQQKEWNEFANLLANNELPRWSYLNGGYNYRIPPPGAIIEDGYLKANVEYPGLDVYYTLDGSDPSQQSQLFEKPVEVGNTADIKLICADKSGKLSRVIEIKK